MTKKEITTAIAQDSGVSQIQVKEIVQQVFEFIVDTLVHEGVIELRAYRSEGKSDERKATQARAIIRTTARCRGVAGRTGL